MLGVAHQDAGYPIVWLTLYKVGNPSSNERITSIEDLFATLKMRVFCLEQTHLIDTKRLSKLDASIVTIDFRLIARSATAQQHRRARFDSYRANDLRYSVISVSVMDASFFTAAEIPPSLFKAEIAGRAANLYLLI